MKTGKTPYEIRADLLHLAHRIVFDRKQAESDIDEEVIVAPTAYEVIDEAEKLNLFVSQSAER